VLFVHPWEMVDLRAAPLPWHCRLGTGARALDALGEVIRMFKARGARFLTMRDLASVLEQGQDADPACDEHPTVAA
jgi:hypothetical protein